MKGPVLSFDMNATRGAKLAKIDPVATPEVANDAPTPTARFSDKAIARAEVASLYAGLLGVELQRTDLLERLTTDSGEDLSSDAIAAALSNVGLITKVSKARKISTTLWPALAEITSGQVILVMRQDGDILTIYDTTQTGNQAEVPVTEFAPVFTVTSFGPMSPSKN